MIGYVRGFPVKRGPGIAVYLAVVLMVCQHSKFNKTC